jgi:hypothetical protein
MFGGCFMYLDLNYSVRNIIRKELCRGIYKNAIVTLKRIQKLKLKHLDKMMIHNIEVLDIEVLIGFA